MHKDKQNIGRLKSTECGGLCLDCKTHAGSQVSRSFGLQLDRKRPFPAEVVFKNTSGGLFVCSGSEARAHALVNLVTALVPSDTACLASSPGRIRRTEVWISRLVTVGFLL